MPHFKTRLQRGTTLTCIRAWPVTRLRHLHSDAVGTLDVTLPGNHITPCGMDDVWQVTLVVISTCSHSKLIGFMCGMYTEPALLSRSEGVCCRWAAHSRPWMLSGWQPRPLRRGTYAGRRTR